MNYSETLFYQFLYNNFLRKKCKEKKNITKNENKIK